MVSLSYNEYCNLFAARCLVCKGEKRQVINGANKVCSCQLRATVKFRFEQVDVSPACLKYKTWDDFTGVLVQSKKTVGSLSPFSAIEAKRKAMSYCFEVPTGEKLDRAKHLVLHNRIKEGKSILIAGERNSGRTMLATLILKEAAYTSVYQSSDLSFRFVPSSDIIDAARWDTCISSGEVVRSKTIDREFLNELRDIGLLAIDGIDNVSEYGHTAPPDNIAMDSFFGYRKFESLPLILVCSLKFLDGLRRISGQAAIKRFWGEEFLALIAHPDNVVIQLKKDRHVS